MPMPTVQERWDAPQSPPIPPALESWSAHQVGHPMPMQSAMESWDAPEAGQTWPMQAPPQFMESSQVGRSCGSCGSFVAGGTNFCVQCGQRMVDQVRQTSPMPSAPQYVEAPQVAQILLPPSALQALEALQGGFTGAGSPLAQQQHSLAPMLQSAAGPAMGLPALAPQVDMFGGQCGLAGLSGMQCGLLGGQCGLAGGWEGAAFPTASAHAMDPLVLLAQAQLQAAQAQAAGTAPAFGAAFASFIGFPGCL